MVIIGIGSNVGAREAMLTRAVSALEALLGPVIASSRVETPALLLPDSPKEWDVPFLNMAVSAECSMQPHALLAELKRIEQHLGRIDRGRWAPREIDLDILTYDNLEIEEEGLTIPHPELLNRYFALAPLAEIAPNWLYRGKTAKAWLAEKFP